MSIVMDSQDVCGFLRGLCFVALVRSVGRCPSPADLAAGLLDLDGELGAFLPALALFTGIEVTTLRACVDEWLHADETYLVPENVNLQLGLFAGSGRSFAFVWRDGADTTSLYRPLLHTARHLVHAAVRVRMQSSVPLSGAEVFWMRLATFLRRAGGADAIASAVAIHTIVDVASDVLLFNSELATRTEEPLLIERSARVFEELRAIPFERI